MERLSERLKDIALGAAPPQVAAWFRRVWPGADGGFRRTAFRAAFGGAGRRFGGAAPALAPEQRSALLQAGLVAPERRGLDALGRTALLLRALEVVPWHDHVGLVRELIIRGSYPEQIAVLGSLALLPEPERFVELAVDACRTNILDVFEAIACENSFPAAHFPEPSFNQMVVKAMFLGTALARIDGLSRRITPELRRMCADFASERRAAGRPVPADIDLVLN